MTFSTEARRDFLDFALSPEAKWTGNFRELNGAVVRMATLAHGGRISVDTVQEEISRLRTVWAEPQRPDAGDDELLAVLSPEALDQIDLFDRVQLGHVVEVCRASRSLSEAGRKLYEASRTRKTSANDADRLRKYLGRFGLDWSSVTAA